MSLEKKSVILESSQVMTLCKTRGRDFCYQPEYLTKLCKLFPITLIKFVRLSVEVFGSLIAELSSDDFHVIYLSRDPRAIMNSRWNNYPSTTWCVNGSECTSALVLCQDMDNDLTAAFKLQDMYPGRVHILRYEDLALSPSEKAVQLFDALGLHFGNEAQLFISEHTEVDDPNSKIVRDSGKRVTAWMNEMTAMQMLEVQRSCSGTLERYGYISVDSLSRGNEVDIRNILRSLPYAL